MHSSSASLSSIVTEARCLLASQASANDQQPCWSAHLPHDFARLTIQSCHQAAHKPDTISTCKLLSLMYFQKKVVSSGRDMVLLPVHSASSGDICSSCTEQWRGVRHSARAAYWTEQQALSMFCRQPLRQSHPIALCALTFVKPFFFLGCPSSPSATRFRTFALGFAGLGMYTPFSPSRSWPLRSAYQVAKMCTLPAYL